LRDKVYYPDHDGWQKGGNMRIGKEALKKALSLTKLVLNKRTSNPLLTYLHIRGHDGELAVRASSGEVDLEVRLPVEDGVEFGPILVPGSPAILAVENAPGEVELVVETGTISIRAGKWRADLATANPEGFPDWPEIGPDRFDGHIAATDLIRALFNVRYAVSRDSYRGIFRGIQLERHAGGFRAVASDGYRMAIQDIGNTNDQPTHKVVLPSVAVDSLIPFLREAEEGSEINVSLTRSLLEAAFTTPWGGVRTSLRLMEGEFPDYQNVIPKEFPVRAVLDVKSFREALERVSVLADEKSQRVDLLLEEGRAVLTAQGDYGESREEIPATLEGPSISLAYSARYLLDALQRVSGKVMTLQISGQFSPTLIEQEDGGYRAVVVPLRV
jgi:DNA polymerase-3 subunit beta